MKLEVIIAVITSLSTLGVTAILRSVIKEAKEAIAKYKEAKADGYIDEKETLEIAQESFEAIEQIIKLGYALKKVFKK